MSPELPDTPVRLFVAVEIPDRVRDAVASAIEPWRERLGPARWVRPENWHVTVKFLGRTGPDLAERVREACRSAAAGIRPFRVGVEGLGVFPRPASARVLWVGLRDRDGGLPALAAALDRELAREFPPERRPFSAHLTVARFQPPRPLADEIDELRSTVPDADAFRVSSLILFRSHLSPKGARYEPLESFALRG